MNIKIETFEGGKPNILQENVTINSECNFGMIIAHLIQCTKPQNWYVIYKKY